MSNERTANLITAIKFYLENPNKKIGVQEIADILPHKTHLRSVQRMLKQMSEIGFLDKDNAQPKGYMYRPKQPQQGNYP